jgi:hypothetical protein
LVVTALSPDGNVDALKTALHDAGLSLDPLQLIGPDESTSSLAHGIAGAELLTSDTSGGVPGLSGRHRMREFFRNESLSDRLGDLEIPDSEVDNYVEALERGRSVVAYFAKPDTVERVGELFKSVGLLNVRRF